MRKRSLQLALVLAVVGVALVAATAVQAQHTGPAPGIPVECVDLARYDLDHNGRVDGNDFTLWVITVHESGEQCFLGGPAAGCPSWVDVNRDGVVTVSDLDAMATYLFRCVYGRRNTAPE